MAQKTNRDVFIDIQEVHQPELDAQLVANPIAPATGETRRLSAAPCARRWIRRCASAARESRFACGGRLNGAEIRALGVVPAGRLPLHTLRADIDYGLAEARTTYGVIGVEVLDLSRRDPAAKRT